MLLFGLIFLKPAPEGGSVFFCYFALHGGENFLGSLAVGVALQIAAKFGIFGGEIRACQSHIQPAPEGIEDGAAGAGVEFYKF